jgi:hypothetical protein
MENVENYDVKKDRRDLYGARAGRFEVVDVPPLRVLMVDGAGDPNTSGDYRDALEALFVCSYAVRKLCLAELGRKHTVGPLEGLWSAADMETYRTREKDAWEWTLMIVQPDWVTGEMAATAIETAAARELPAGERVRWDGYDEGLSVQTLHVGSYDDEAPVIRRLHDFAADEGYALSGRHHEIYLSDARRTEPARLRTILRQPVSPA